MACQDPHGRNYMAKLIAKYPNVAEVVLDRSTEFSEHHPDHPDFTVKYDYQFLEEKPESNSMLTDTINIFTRKRNMLYFAPQIMADYCRENLMAHSITTSLFSAKWNRVCKQFYYASFTVYLFYVVSMSVLIITEGRT